jgi:short-chain 2-methylacyl-CoA dehydrogenase
MDEGLIPQFFELGLMGIEVPEEFGGTGASFFTAALVVEELSRVDASVGVFVDVQNTLVNNAFLRWGSEELKAKYLPQLASGEGGRLRALRGRLRLRRLRARHPRPAADGGYRLTGQKLWITNGAEAEIFIVFANVDPEAGYKGITAFIVEKDFDGFSVGKKEDKLGIRASSTTELILEDVFVPAENVLGEVGQGYKTAIETLNEGRIGIGAQMIGIGQGALDATVKYVQEREQFGKPIGAVPGRAVPDRQMATELEAARLMVYNAARLKDAGQPFLQEAAMAKLFSSQVAQRIASTAVDLFGGYGFTREYPVEKFYRDSKIGTDLRGHQQHAAADDREEPDRASPPRVPRYAPRSVQSGG